MMDVDLSQLIIVIISLTRTISGWNCLLLSLLVLLFQID